MEVLFLYWCINFTILWCCKVTYYSGIDKYQAYMWGNSRLGYWRIAGSYILCRAITNERLSMAGYATLMGSYLEWYPK